MESTKKHLPGRNFQWNYKQKNVEIGFISQWRRIMLNKTTTTKKIPRSTSPEKCNQLFLRPFPTSPKTFIKIHLKFLSCPVNIQINETSVET